MSRIVGNNGIDVIDRFERRWQEWNVDDLIAWFKYNFIQFKHAKYEIAIEDGCEAKKVERDMDGHLIIEPNWKKISQNLSISSFQAQNILPSLGLESGLGLLKFFGFDDGVFCKHLSKQIYVLVKR